MGEARRDALRVGFDNRLRLQFHGAKISTEGGLFPYRELDDAARLTESGAGDLFFAPRKYEPYPIPQPASNTVLPAQNCAANS